MDSRTSSTRPSRMRLPRRAIRMLHGIDVSNANGSGDWVKVARAGTSFAYLKATEGLTYDDTWYEANRKQGRRAGITEACHFAPAGNNTPDEAVAHLLRMSHPRLGAWQYNQIDGS